MTNNKAERGFTLIELLLAMAFIAFLLLFMVAAILQVTKLYVKGSAIRQINQTGRQLMDDLGSVLRDGSEPTDSSGNNRLCAGGTSYAWNVENKLVVNRFDTDSASGPTTLRFVSVQDPGGSLCKPPIAKIPKAKSIDLIGSDITPLDFSVEKQGMLWSITLLLSTTGSNIPTDVSGGGAPKFECAPDNQFCAFGNFETSVYSRRGND